MAMKYDFDEIFIRYHHYFKEAESTGRRYLPYYEVQPWSEILNPVEREVFEDIREIGIPMYPIFPVAENTYLHFANPFHRVGIEIAYKNSLKALIDRKINLLRAQQWTVFVIPSQSCRLTLEEFFQRKRKDPHLEWEELSHELQSQFFKKYYLENCACLLHYINELYFQKEPV
jgi:hypothetical protein